MYKVEINGQIELVADGTRLSDVLREHGFSVDLPCGGRGVCGKCLVLVDGREELSCRYLVHSDITVTAAPIEEVYVPAEITACGVAKHPVLVLDIGTTTLALALVDTDGGAILRQITATNPQRVYGADVMSRIDYASRHGAVPLKRVLVGEINRLLSQLPDHRADTLYVAGNTTMLHLLFGEECTSLGVAPYTPHFLGERRESAVSLGIIGVGEVVSLPGIHTFVGADIVAGLHCIGLPAAGKYRLLVDLGTNAEVALYSSDVLLCTAAAAGPCFEGASISCGMSAVRGAVYAYSADGVKTIDNVPPRGVCGTGLVDVMAALVKSDAMDETGYLEGESFMVAPNVTLTQEDVRQFQLAKAAVYAAIMTLLFRQGVSYDDVEQLYITGGFATTLDIDNAVSVGLLPAELKGRCTAIANSSLQGAVRFACGDQDLSVWLRNGTYVDLSADPAFTDLFIQSMMFHKETGI